MKKIYKYFVIVLLYLLTDCTKLVAVDPPVTATDESIVYSSDANATAVLTGLYIKLSSEPIDNPGSLNSLSLYTGLYSDELTLSANGATSGLTAYYENKLEEAHYGSEYWNNLYNYIYTCNSAIENLKVSKLLTPAVKTQLLGEAEFMRAYLYFYLVNLYGDLPLVISADYKSNSILKRSPTVDIYKQIVNDLTDAEADLSAKYLDATLLNETTERVRPTKWAAEAMLSRVYLYMGDWSDAESQATHVINNTTNFNLNSLDSVFLMNSSESIWQLQPVTTGAITNTSDAFLFIIQPSGSSINQPVYLSSNLLDSFEVNDQRKKSWVDSIIVNGEVYYFPFKYKVNTPDAPVTEYIMMLRLGEQYLVRAEARAELNNTGGAASDLNILRSRAGLPNTWASDQASLLSAIFHERQVELFTEIGHRWFDLKRSGNINSIMSIVSPEKGGSWSPAWQLYPLGQGEIQFDPNLKQNPGY